VLSAVRTNASNESRAARNPGISEEQGEMPTLSSGLLLFRARGHGEPQVLLVHMGGPFWKRRDAGGWSLPKGEHEPGEDSLAAARREFAEELGITAPAGREIDLGEIKQRSGKVIHAWALAADIDASEIESNTFELEWPRGSGKRERFPEVDRADWFGIAAAREKLVSGQVPFLERLLERAELSPEALRRARGR
jgi:predicted NUDIX family NTP pyrophosphohydrolase